jgi:hypothetical protein
MLSTLAMDDQMNTRKHIKVDPELQRRAHAKAAALGISFAEYVRRLMENDLGLPRQQRRNISGIRYRRRRCADHIAAEIARDVRTFLAILPEQRRPWSINSPARAPGACHRAENGAAFFLSEVRNMKIREGRWHSGSGHRRTQECVEKVYIDMNTAVPDQPGRS